MYSDGTAASQHAYSRWMWWQVQAGELKSEELGSTTYTTQHYISTWAFLSVWSVVAYDWHVSLRSYRSVVWWWSLCLHICLRWAGCCSDGHTYSRTQCLHSCIAWSNTSYVWLLVQAHLCSTPPACRDLRSVLTCASCSWILCWMALRVLHVSFGVSNAILYCHTTLCAFIPMSCVFTHVPVGSVFCSLGGGAYSLWLYYVLDVYFRLALSFLLRAVLLDVCGCCIYM